MRSFTVYGQTHPLSPKNILNIWVTLASFFKWPSSEFSIPNPMQKIPAPRFQRASIEAFTKGEIKQLLKACTQTKEANTRIRKSYVYSHPTAKRDRALILTLLDTGLRAMEFCALRVGNADLKTGKVEVEQGIRGGCE